MLEEKHSPDKSPCVSKGQQNLALFVGSLSEKTDQTALSKYFCKFGEISSINLISDWTTGTSKCCAIIICKKPSTLSKIMAAPKHIIDGKKIRVTEAEPERKGTKKISTNCLFVGNITSKMKEEEIRKIFQKFGNILDSKFFRNASTKLNTKNCIIEFSDSKAVEAAFKSKDNKEIGVFGFRISPLKHKIPTPMKKEKVKKGALQKLNLEQSVQANQDEDLQMKDKLDNYSNFIEEEISPIVQVSPFNFGPEKNGQLSTDFLQFTNKNSDDLTSELTDSRVHTNQDSCPSDDSVDPQENYLTFVTLADVICEDDLAAAFFSNSPYLGHLKTGSASLRSAELQLQFEQEVI